MAPAAEKDPGPGTLKANYEAPASTKTFEHPLPSPSISTAKEKTQYLSTLRESVVKLQDELNSFLTSKMEEDKISATSAGKKVNEQVEEENYGEETMDENA